MPIKDDEGVRVLEFGYGDINVGTVMLENKLNSIVFIQDSVCRKIGEKNTHGVNGKSHRELDTRVAMHFNSSESLDVVIGRLQYIRDNFNQTVEIQENVSNE